MSRITVFKCDECGDYPIEPINSKHAEKNFCNKEECKRAAERYSDHQAELAKKCYRLI